jgi:hypothetical protein
MHGHQLDSAAGGIREESPSSFVFLGTGNSERMFPLELSKQVTTRQLLFSSMRRFLPLPASPGDSEPSLVGCRPQVRCAYADSLSLSLVIFSMVPNPGVVDAWLQYELAYASCIIGL